MKKLTSFLMLTVMMASLGLASAYAEDSVTMLPVDREELMPPGGPQGQLPPDGEMPPEKPEGEMGMPPQQGGPMGEPVTMLDTARLSETLAAMDESDARTEAAALLEAYGAALDAERVALGNGMASGNGEMPDAARAAVEEAFALLEAALEGLGVNIADYALAPDMNAPAEGKVL